MRACVRVVHYDAINLMRFKFDCSEANSIGVDSSRLISMLALFFLLFFIFVFLFYPNFLNVLNLFENSENYFKI